MCEDSLSDGLICTCVPGQGRAVELGAGGWGQGRGRAGAEARCCRAELRLLLLVAGQGSPRGVLDRPGMPRTPTGRHVCDDGVLWRVRLSQVRAYALRCVAKCGPRGGTCLAVAGAGGVGRTRVGGRRCGGGDPRCLPQWRRFPVIISIARSHWCIILTSYVRRGQCQSYIILLSKTLVERISYNDVVNIGISAKSVKSFRPACLVAFSFLPFVIP